MVTGKDAAPRTGARRGAASVIITAAVIFMSLCCCALGTRPSAGEAAAGNTAPVTAGHDGGRCLSPEWLNVRAFGAAGDGTTDDTAAIQAALDAGTHIYFPVGRYVVNQLTLQETSGVVLSGYGATLVKKAGSEPWTRILDIVSTDSLLICGLTFDGNKPHVAGSPEKGCGSIYGTHLTNFIFRDLRICNSFYGTVNLTDCHNGRITDCSFTDIDVGVLGMDRANSELVIERCAFIGGTSEGISFGIYSAVTPELLSDIGYHDSISITNCRFLNKDANCIQLRNVRNVVVSGNSLERTDGVKRTVGIMIDPDAVPLADIIPDNVVIHSNRISGMLYEGIKVTGGTGIMITDNCFDGIHSFNIAANGGCTVLSNTFVNIQKNVPAIIYVPGGNIRLLDNQFRVGSVQIPCVVGVMSTSAAIQAQGNIIWKDSANPCAVIGSDTCLPASVTTGFSVIEQD